MTTIGFGPTAPVLRIFEEALAREFYVGFLGMAVDWEHRFGDGLPLYAQVSRAGLVLHLSGHFGDGTPGAVTHVEMTGIEEFHRELVDRRYKHLRPGLGREDWGRTMDVVDPFGNQIRFLERPSR